MKGDTRSLDYTIPHIGHPVLMKKPASKNLEARNLGIQDENQSSSLYGASSFLCLSKNDGADGE